MVFIIVVLEKILYGAVEFLMAFVQTWHYQARARRGEDEPMDMDVDAAHLHAGEPPEPRGHDVTEIMEQMAEQAQELAMLRAQVRVIQHERDVARGHNDRQAGELERAHEAIRDLRLEYDAVERTLYELRMSNRRHIEHCPNGGPIFISKHGRRWHYTQGCEHIQARDILEITPCLTCTGGRLAI